MTSEHWNARLIREEHEAKEAVRERGRLRAEVKSLKAENSGLRRTEGALQRSFLDALDDVQRLHDALQAVAACAGLPKRATKIARAALDATEKKDANRVCESPAPAPEQGEAPLTGRCDEPAGGSTCEQWMQCVLDAHVVLDGTNDDGGLTLVNRVRALVAQRDEARSELERLRAENETARAACDVLAEECDRRLAEVEAERDEARKLLTDAARALGMSVNTAASPQGFMQGVEHVVASRAAWRNAYDGQVIRASEAIEAEGARAAERDAALALLNRVATTLDDAEWGLRGDANQHHRARVLRLAAKEIGAFLSRFPFEGGEPPAAKEPDHAAPLKGDEPQRNPLEGPAAGVAAPEGRGCTDPAPAAGRSHGAAPGEGVARRVAGDGGRRVSPAPFKVGDWVDIRDTNAGSPGRIEAVSGDRADIRWQDGSTGPWPVGSLVLMPAPEAEGCAPAPPEADGEGAEGKPQGRMPQPEDSTSARSLHPAEPEAPAPALAVGQRVGHRIWRWEGRIKQIEGCDALVQQDDGSTPLWVDLDNLEPVPNEAPARFKVGDRVRGKFTGNVYRVERVDPDGEIHCYLHGIRFWVSSDEVEPAPDEEAPAPPEAGGEEPRVPIDGDEPHWSSVREALRLVAKAARRAEQVNLEHTSLAAALELAAGDEDSDFVVKDDPDA